MMLLAHGTSMAAAKSPTMLVKRVGQFLPGGMERNVIRFPLKRYLGPHFGKRRKRACEGALPWTHTKRPCCSFKAEIQIDRRLSRKSTRMTLTH